MRALLSFYPLFAQRRARFLSALLLSMVTLLAGAALLGLSGWFLTAAFLTTAAASFNLFGPSSAVRGLSLLRILSRYGEKLVGHDATLGTLAEIREWLFRAMMPRIGRLRHEVRHGDLVQRLTADIETLDVVFLLSIGPMLTGLVIHALVAAGLFLALPQAALPYAAAAALAAIAVPIGLGFATRRAGADIVKASAVLRGLALDAVEGHADLVALGAVDLSRMAFEEAAERLGAARRRLGRFAAAAGLAVQLLAGAAVLIVLIVGLSALGHQAISAPLLVGLMLAVIGSFEAGAATVRSVARLGAALAAAERLQALAETPPGVPDTARASLAVPTPTIGLRNLSFGFDPARPVLRGLDLDVAPGECIALTGPSGSGKSTLLSLLVRLEDAREGACLVGDRDVRDWPLAELRRHVALLEQNAPVFLGTIADNLRIGRGNADEAALWAALDGARLGAFVRGLPAGLQTLVGEQGRMLSAGQARRLCLARALLSSAHILLLDEPTSGLDRDTELGFFEDLRSATQGRTVVLATHAELPPGVADRSFRFVDGKLEPKA